MVMFVLFIKGYRSSSTCRFDRLFQFLWYCKGEDLRSSYWPSTRLQRNTVQRQIKFGCQTQRNTVQRQIKFGCQTQRNTVQRQMRVGCQTQRNTVQRQMRSGLSDTKKYSPASDEGWLSAQRERNVHKKAHKHNQADPPSLRCYIYISTERSTRYTKLGNQRHHNIHTMHFCTKNQNKTKIKTKSKQTQMQSFCHLLLLFTKQQQKKTKNFMQSFCYLLC